MRSAWLRRSSRRRPSDFPVAEFSDLKRLIPYGGARLSHSRSRLPASSASQALVCRDRKPSGGCYGWLSVYRVCYDTRHLYVPQTYQQERGCRAPRPPKGGSSPKPSGSDARATQRRTASPCCQDGPAKIRLGAGAPIGTRTSAALVNVLSDSGP